MLQRSLYKFILMTLVGMGGIMFAKAQDSTGQPIRIIQSGKLNVIKRDGLELMRVLPDTINGVHQQVIFQQGTTLLYCDSAYNNTTEKTIDAFGHVHINNSDSVHTYSDFLHYRSDVRIASLRGNAKLTDGKVVITAPEMEYDMNAKIGSYLNNGKLVNEESILTSREAFYYTDTKDVYFKQNVVLVNPNYTLSTDTLLYNTGNKIATIVAPTTINDGKSISYVSSGTYETEQGLGHFTSRPMVTDSTGDFTADNIQLDRKTGIAVATGNMIWRDTVRKIIVLGNYGLVNENEKSVLATQKPVTILYSGKDTMFVAADTLFTGLIKKNDTVPVFAKDAIVAMNEPFEHAGEELDPGLMDSAQLAQRDSARNVFKQRADAAIAGRTDSVAAKPLIAVAPPKTVTDSLKVAPVPARIRPVKPTLPDSLHTAQPANRVQSDSLHLALNKVPLTDTTQQKDTTEQRFLRAYHNVRIYSDSLQGVADSIYYSSVDSVMRMYKEPVLWAKELQLTGDTIFLFTKNQKADKLLLDQSGLLASEVGHGYYNQIKGNTITGYFRDDKLYYMRIYGNAESIVYQQDSDSAFTNVQQSTCAMIDIHFVDGDIETIVNIKDHEGAIYPFNQLPEEHRVLSNFKWEFKRKPKSKYELIGR